MQQVPYKFACFFRATKERGVTFQQLNFLKRMYVIEHNKALCQRAKLKPESAVPPCFEGQHSVPEKTVCHVVRSVSPLPPPLSEKAAMSEVLKPTAITDSAKTAVGPTSQEEKQWKEMKLQMDSLPGILARLSKIKLTGIIRNMKDTGKAEINGQQLKRIVLVLGCSLFCIAALVVSTASAGFAMAPVPFDLTCFLIASLGTGLSSCAANAINQVGALLLASLQRFEISLS
ncbi:hypothetical protein JD844_011729 [Phrynosoma platyrhinos]|uniref:Uncharacterized protein n=1 Tax=Phrynosoma platyrhinos TaxID=52577 RepID=A0ABQ7TIJ0_PHRPL|nr:hypothetical protein JD844_011729 [Phrynosoma platyrhinos]